MLPYGYPQGQVMAKQLTVKKDNALVAASYNLTLGEQRLILLAIAAAGHELDARHVVTAEQYADCYKLTAQGAYRALREASLQLFERRYTVRTDDKTKLRRWVSGVDYVEGAGQVVLHFAPDVLEYLGELKNRFTVYALEQVASLTSAHAVRLYELLISWRSVGKTPVFELAAFREQLGILPDEYPRMTNFKQRVLDPALAQINEHTDIEASYQQHKTGRKITGFSFTFSHKKDAQAPSNRCSKTIDFVDEQNPTAKQLGYYAKLLSQSHWATQARVLQGVTTRDAISVITAHIKQPKNLAKLMPTIKKLIAAKG